jgi:hypothetical protein
MSNFQNKITSNQPIGLTSRGQIPIPSGQFPRPAVPTPPTIKTNTVPPTVSQGQITIPPSSFQRPAPATPPPIKTNGNPIGPQGGKPTLQNVTGQTQADIDRLTKAGKV